ncbi:hypothetical protein HNR55_001591 [Acetobacter lovaniensis]|uniref:Uncharacterized protein n=1 Tax=Acetobacter lovaniensis TaxID=104100 RepID=A0A841QF33_9PROT|nr:hypothetical protein [Acetobacter lovaniensis]
MCDEGAIRYVFHFLIPPEFAGQRHPFTMDAAGNSAARWKLFSGTGRYERWDEDKGSPCRALLGAVSFRTLGFFPAQYL